MVFISAVTLPSSEDIPHLTAYSLDGVVIFFEIRDAPPIPTLRVLHQCKLSIFNLQDPYIMPHMQCDKGAIKHILSGSHVMCPGLTSAGAKMDDSVQKGQIVAIMAEGKEHAMGIGMMTMSPTMIRSENKGVGIEVIHFLGDSMWNISLEK